MSGLAFSSWETSPTQLDERMPCVLPVANLPSAFAFPRGL